MRLLRAFALSTLLLGSVSFTGASSVLCPQFEMTRVERKAWNSSVTVWNGAGYGTGTYITYEGWNLVLTAYHVVSHTPLSLVRSSGDDMLFAVPVYLDEARDLAILLIPGPVPDRSPLPFGPRHVSQMDIGEETISVGSPNANSRLLLDGRVVGHNGDRNMWVEGLTWFGASGSALFDRRGRFIGILSGMDVAIGPNLPLENLILVEPIEIDWDRLHALATPKF